MTEHQKLKQAIRENRRNMYCKTDTYLAIGSAAFIPLVFVMLAIVA